MDRPKVVGIGLNKTGTSSLREMLKLLGYKKLISVTPEVIEDIKNCDFNRIDTLLQRNQGFEDLPWPFLYRYINENFKNVKFVLTLRESPEKWFESLLAHSQYMGPSPTRKKVYGFYHVKGLKKHFIRLYNIHEQKIKEYFSNQPERLLVMRLESGEGINELSQFLNLLPPKHDTPHMNKKGNLKGKNIRRAINLKTKIHDWLNYSANLEDNFLQFKSY